MYKEIKGEGPNSQYDIIHHLTASYKSNEPLLSNNQYVAANHNNAVDFVICF